jgi:hypothetical protein
VAKELRTAEQLSDMIVGALGISEVDVRVRKDHAFGWQPTVVSSPGDSIGYQRRVEEIANRLRFHFDLREWRLVRAPMRNEKTAPKGGLSAALIEAENQATRTAPPADLVTQLLVSIYAVRLRAVK